MIERRRAVRIPVPTLTDPVSKGEHRREALQRQTV